MAATLPNALARLLDESTPDPAGPPQGFWGGGPLVARLEHASVHTRIFDEPASEKLGPGCSFAELGLGTDESFKVPRF